MSEASRRIIATYRLRVPEAQVEARARALATEQSVEMPLDAIDDPRVLQEVVARVADIRAHGGAFDVDLAIAPETTGFEASQLLNMIFGNCSLQPEVELVAVSFPKALVARFAGPRFGIAGIRELVGAASRPLTCSALKPQGSTLDHLCRIAGAMARAGIDVIKDDHGLANQAITPFTQRVPAVQRAIEAANRESGGRTVYAPTFSGAPQALREQARIARECGVGMALVAPMLVGVPAFIEMQSFFGGPVMAHPSFGGAARIAPPVIFGTLFRLFGADATIFANHGGRFSYSRETCLALCDAARSAWEGLEPALPVPAGGMTLERVEEMRADYGDDAMLLIGGGLLSAREHLFERTREFVQAVRG